MQNPPTDFGARRSVHRASLGWLWLLLLCAAPIGLVTAVAAVYAFKSISPTDPTGKATNVAIAFGRLGAAALLLALVVATCLSDFRAWYATRTVRLVIYEKGLTYESKGHRESCSWGEIEHIDFKLIEVKIKNSAPRKVSVVRAIVKRDGTLISLAETLNLQKITNLITEERKASTREG